MSIGKYIAPTSARTLIQGKVPVNISRRRSGSHGNSIHRYGQDVNSFFKNFAGSDALLTGGDRCGIMNKRLKNEIFGLDLEARKKFLILH